MYVPECKPISGHSFFTGSTISYLTKQLSPSKKITIIRLVVTTPVLFPVITVSGRYFLNDNRYIDTGKEPIHANQ